MSSSFAEGARGRRRRFGRRDDVIVEIWAEVVVVRMAGEAREEEDEGRLTERFAMFSSSAGYE